MRTIKGKRIGLVPITLVAVFALAAFLSAGLLLAPNGSPTAEAQSADCEITVSDAGAVTLPTKPTNAQAATDPHCSVRGNTATVQFKGDVGATEDRDLSLLIEDANGPLSIYANGATYVEATATDPSQIQVGGAEASPKRYRFQLVKVPKAAQNAQGVIEGQNVTITVSGDVVIWQGSVSVSEPIANIPTGDRYAGSRAVAGGSPSTLLIALLGEPAIGVDAPTGRSGDRNSIIDDYQQCVAADGSDTLAGTYGSDADPDGEEANCTPDGTDVLDDGNTGTAGPADMAESRSKLLVQKGAAAAAAPDGTLLDATSEEVTLTGTESEATIYAVVEDSKGQALAKTEVTFSFDSVPAGIIRSRPADVDAAIDATATYPTGITATSDAVASYTVRGLPTGDNSYRATVTVMAGSLNLGTIVLARTGSAADLEAGIYDYANCVNTNDTADDMSDDTFSMDMKDCAMADPARFPRGGTLAVNATTTDALGSKRDSDSWQIDDIDESDVLKVVKTRADTATDAYLLQVKDDAPLGMHPITVSNGRTGDARLTDELTFSVAGPPASYDISGPDYIALRGSGTFTVTAMDENGSAPHFKDDASKKVEIFIQGLAPGNVRGLDGVSMLTLDADTAMGSFTVYAPTGATQGDPIRIFVGSGATPATQEVTFGAAPTVAGMPMNVSATATSHTEITVSWDAPASDGGSAITHYIIERRYMGDMGGDIPSDGYSGMNGANRSFAFSNAMQWWETLNCKGMLAAAGSSASDMPMAGESQQDIDDRAMYCGHFLNTVPSNVADATKELSAEAKMAVEALFAKRYVITTDTMTTHMDTMLMANTEYTYRVSAVNGEGRSSWSAAAMATTDMTPTPPTASGMLDAVSLLVGRDAAMVDASGAFTMTEDDAITAYAATSSDDMVATASADSMGMVTITAVGAGTATVSVTASDDDGASNAVDIMVTVMAPTPPMASGTLDAVMLTLGDDAAMVDASGAFTMTESDAITAYAATSSDDMIATASADDMGMVTVTAMRVGSATVSVTATDADGTSDAVTIMVTVSAPAAPGAASGLSVELSGVFNDQVTLTWTAGTGANYHFVAGHDGSGFAVWEFASGNTTHTVDNLTSGTEYTFNVLSGAFAEDADGNWPGAWSAAGWSNAAKVTAP